MIMENSLPEKGSTYVDAFGMVIRLRCGTPEFFMLRASRRAVLPALFRPVITLTPLEREISSVCR